MAQQHLIKMPPELLNKLCNNPGLNWIRRLELAYQAGADQELEACCEWIHGETSDECFVANLRAARRPKPPSLKEQALAALHISFDRGYLRKGAVDIIRHALEQTPDNE